MRAVRMASVLAVALLSLVVLSVACGGDSGPSGGSPVRVEGGLPPTFPSDFPLYPDLKIVRSSPLGERYVIEAESEDPAQDIIDYYDEELRKERWEILDVEKSSDPPFTVLRFTAPGWSVDGRLQVNETDDGRGRTVVGIALPIDAGEGN